MSYIRLKKKRNSILDNDDILMEILIRLPIKSLMRFKSVSKHWNFLISSPTFSRLIYPDIHSVSGILLRKNSYLRNSEYHFVSLSDKPTTNDPPFKSLTFVNHPLGLKVLQSCHGLLFCSSSQSIPYSFLKGDYYIYNPTTKQFRSLPHPGETPTYICDVTLAYNPANSPHYQVICVRQAELSKACPYYGSWEEFHYLSDEDAGLDKYQRYQIEIYSSKTKSWRHSRRTFTAHYDLNIRNGVHWMGAVHWVSLHCPSLYFNINEEKILRMPIPADALVEGCRFGYLNESRGHLHFVAILPCTTKFDVYELEGDYSRWFVKYRVDLEAMMNSFPAMKEASLDLRHKVTILDIIREVEDEESYMVLHIPGKAIRYKFKDGSFYQIYSFATDSEATDEVGGGYVQFWWFDPYRYIETLVGF